MQRSLLLAAFGLVLSLATPVLAAEPGELDGIWTEVLHRPSRTEHPAYLPPRAPATLLIDGHLFVEKYGDRACRQSLIRFVPGQTPKAVDLMTTVSGEFWLTRAIYEVEGDRLTICEAGRDKPRPTAFHSGKGIEDQVRLLTTFTRQAAAPSKVKLGQAAPAIDAMFSSGNPLLPEQLAGKVVLMTFWSANDAVLKRHFAKLREIRREFAQTDRFQIVSIRLGGNWDDWLGFLGKQPPLDKEFPLHPFDSDGKWWQAFHPP